MGLKVDSCEEKSGTQEAREQETNKRGYEERLLVLHNSDHDENEAVEADIEEHECEVGSNPNPLLTLLVV